MSFRHFMNTGALSAEAAAIRRTQAVIEFDPSGKILWANDLFLAAMGYSLAEIVGQHHSIFVEAGARTRPDYQGFWPRLAAGEAIQAQFLRIGKGGARLWLQAVYTPVIDRGSRVKKVVKFATDITSHKADIANMVGQLAALDKAQAVIEFDLTGKILHANTNFLAVTGYALEEVVGQHHRIFVRDEERSSPNYMQFWEKLRRGEYDEGRYSRIGKGGKVVWLQASYNPILDAMGAPSKVVKYATDITASKENEAQMEFAIAEVGTVVAAAKARDLTCRIPLENLNAKNAALCEGVNQLVATLANIVGQVAVAAQGIDTAAKEISIGADDLSKRTEEQASSLEETAATTEELAASVKASASNARNAATLASEATVAAQSGGDIAGEAVRAMARIEDASQKIQAITRVIDDIAFQTNLLALNAAVEAARAGDAGKGFAVVASEVRTLAQRSGEAAKDISSLLSSSNAEVSEGVKLVRKAGESLTVILDASRKVASTIAEISAAGGEQANGIDEMSQTVAHLDEMTQSNAALAEESAASANALADRIAQLNLLVAGYRTEAGGSAEALSPIGLQRQVSAAFTSRLVCPPASSATTQPPLRRLANAHVSSGWHEF
ncbi:methyl-accepting chemotaxis protein [Bosea sp. AAP35]|uniref:methyl-accepting chemotaxis protein n=1 Tax=Bosea sp. AAP35 TaxID=1523417 RepID=UPI000B06BE7A|nr:methyl-accepting chemotaxis protein [Bosea sp. AAP35]